MAQIISFPSLPQILAPNEFLREMLVLLVEEPGALMDVVIVRLALLSAVEPEVSQLSTLNMLYTRIMPL